MGDLVVGAAAGSQNAKAETLAKEAFDRLLGNRVSKRLLRTLTGTGYFRILLPLTRYRACHMVQKGEHCLLGGIYSADTVRDFLRVVGDYGRVVVVEANPSNVKRLKASFKDAANVTFVTKAIWDRAGTMSFLASGEGDLGYNRLETEELQAFPLHMEEDPVSITVETDSLDSIANEMLGGVVHHINLTINGAELRALDGIGQLLETSPKVRVYINSEFPDPYADVVQKLRELGFKTYTARVMRTLNKRITLMRVYAVR